MARKTMKINGEKYIVIDQATKEEHELVCELCTVAKELKNHVNTIKKAIVGKINSHLEETAGKYGKDWKGNAHLFTLDETFKIMVKISEKVKFTKEMAIAKQLYDNWIKRISENSNQELIKLVNKTFAVDSKGNISKSRLMSLRKIASEDADKVKADKITDEAIRHLIETAYYTFYEKKDEEWKKIEVNFSAL